MTAIVAGDEELVVKLIDSGVDINLQDKVRSISLATIFHVSSEVTVSLFRMGELHSCMLYYEHKMIFFIFCWIISPT